jgi:hypothetical protein
LAAAAPWQPIVGRDGDATTVDCGRDATPAEAAAGCAPAARDATL